MTRDDAFVLMCEFTASESLRKHMLAVEAAMLWYARHFAATDPTIDQETWAVTGLLHDFDYEQHPNLGEDGHPFWGVRYLREHTDLSEPMLQAILGHYRESGVVRDTMLARTLFAVDELCGLITAAVLVRPDKNIMNLETASVVKKMKDKAFAKGVNRDDIRIGVEEIGIELSQHVGNVIAAMQERAVELGLAPQA
jgi:predicted hydrolase (HD superfamily)